VIIPRVLLVTPEGVFYDGPAESLTAPGVEGRFGVLAQHAPMVAALQPGYLKIISGTEILFFAVTEGYVRVERDRVFVLCQQMRTATYLEEAQRKALAMAAERTKEIAALQAHAS